MMKEIINGKLYSIDSTTRVAYFDANASNDDDFAAESLYRTHEGKYFLWITKSSGAEALLPVDKQEALSWLIVNDFSDAETAAALEVEIA